jgi:exportin-7
MSTEEEDAIDSELSSKVLQLMNVNQSVSTPVCLLYRIRSCAVPYNKPWIPPRLHGKNGSEKLEMAFLHFFTEFRKSYIGESHSRVVKMYTKLSETFGLNDQNMVCSVSLLGMFFMLAHDVNM